MSSRSIKEANQTISREFAALMQQRSILLSMLDDPEDETPDIESAEERLKRLKARVEFVTRDRSFIQKWTHTIKRSANSGVIQRRDDLSQDVSRAKQVYDKTSLHLAQSELGQYGFDSNSSTALPASLSDPCFIWTLHFRQINLPSVRDVWREMRYDEGSMLRWWRSDLEFSYPTDSDGWSDYKRLARRIVTRVLEVLKSQTIKLSRHFLHLKLLAERLRELVLYQVTACYRFSSEWMRFKELMEQTVPIIYLVSEVFKSARIPTLNVQQNDRIEDNLHSLEPYVRELRDKAYLLGNDLEFDASQFIKSEDARVVFNFDSQQGGTTKNQKRLIGMDSHLGGETPQDLVLRLENIDEKQLKVKEIVCESRSSNRTQPLKPTLTITKKLDTSILRDMGLKELKSIVHEGYHHIGSGGYANVCKMDQVFGDNRVAVAVKRARPDTGTAKRIAREASIWIGLNHKHILPLLGFVDLGPLEYQPCLVSRLCHADLKQFIKAQREAPEKQALTEERKFKFLRDIIFGLDYLHSKGISHGDLRAANVLVTNDLVDDDSCYAVLNDFGMAEYTETNIRHTLDNLDLSSVNQKTNDRWLAPELFKSQPRAGSLARVSKAGDVYAFGVVYLEVIFEKNPYHGIVGDIGHAKLNGVLPANKEDLQSGSEVHWTIMRGCWEDVDKRWSMSMAGVKVLTFMQSLLLQGIDDHESPDMSGLPETFTQYAM